MSPSRRLTMNTPWLPGIHGPRSFKPPSHGTRGCPPTSAPNRVRSLPAGSSTVPATALRLIVFRRPPRVYHPACVAPHVDRPKPPPLLGKDHPPDHLPRRVCPVVLTPRQYLGAGLLGRIQHSLAVLHSQSHRLP